MRLRQDTPLTLCAAIMYNHQEQEWRRMRMKRLFLGDLHGNLQATLAMEKQMERIGADEVWFLGDAVGKGPNSPETCDWVRAHCDHFIGGNWDYGLGGKEYEADFYYWEQLGEERMAWLNSLPREGEVTIGGVRFRLFHGRPVTGLLQAQSPKEELKATFDCEQGHFGGVIFADSHRPFIRTLSTGYILNTGSVGNSMGVPRAHALLLEDGDSPDDPILMTVISVPYSNEAAADAARSDPNLPYQAEYIHEVMTGEYSRAHIKDKKKDEA